MQTQTKNWPPAKILYLILSIMLTLSAIPFLAYFVNYSLASSGAFNYLGILYDLSGLVIAITVLIRAKKDGMKKLGAIFAVVFFILAILCDFMFFWLSNELYFYMSDTASAVLGFNTILSIIAWVFNLVAVILSYINTFSKKNTPNSVQTNMNGMVNNGQPRVHTQVTPMGSPSNGSQQVNQGVNSEPVNLGYSATPTMGQPTTPAAPTMTESTVTATPVIPVVNATTNNEGNEAKVASNSSVELPKSSQSTGYVSQVTADIISDIAKVETPVKTNNSVQEPQSTSSSSSTQEMSTTAESNLAQETIDLTNPTPIVSEKDETITTITADMLDDEE